MIPTRHLHSPGKQRGNSLFYLMVLVGIMAITLSSALNMLRPLQLSTTWSSQQRLMIERVAQEHVALIRNRMRDNPDLFLVDSLYTGTACGVSGFPCYRRLDTANFNTAFDVSGANHHIYTKAVTLNNTAVNITSTLSEQWFRRFDGGTYNSSFYVKLTVADASGKSLSYEEKFSLSPEYCATDTSIDATSTVSFPNFSNDDTTDYRLGPTFGPFVQVGLNAVCWLPNMSGTDAKCFDDSSLGSNIQVELLHGNVVYAPITNGGLGTACIGGGDPWEGCEQLSDANEQYSVVELVTSSATSFSGKTKAFRIRAIDQAYKRVGAGVGITTEHAMVDDLTRNQVGIFSYPPPVYDDDGDYYHRMLLMWLDVDAEALRYDTIEISPDSGSPNTSSSNSTIDLTTVATDITTNDRIGFNAQSGDAVLALQDEGELFHVKVLPPANPANSDTSMVRFENTTATSWSELDVINDLGATSVEEFGTPVLSKDGRFAVVPVTVNTSSETWIVAFNLHNEKITASTNVANSGGVRGLILYKFKSGPAANQSDQVTTVDDIYLYYSSVSNQFHWFAQDTASALDGNMYSWSPSTYGNGNATPNQWVTNAQPIGQIRNFKHRGNNPSGSVNGYSGETYNVQIRTINGSPDISDWVDSTVNSIAYLPHQNWMVYNYSDTAGANCVGAIFNLQGNTATKASGSNNCPYGGLSINNLTHTALLTRAQAAGANAVEDFSLLDASTSLVTSGFDLSDNRSAGDGGIRFNSPNKYTYILNVPAAPSAGNRPKFVAHRNYCALTSTTTAQDVDKTFSTTGGTLEMLNPDYDYVQGMTLTWPR
ncbi:MAG: hypothetical protein KC475_01525 [Cyanobacteria bacterium HKST-UBA03]|nr:hypothetical protein [Cyanobacteria bacterium HKST-UBA03]